MANSIQALWKNTLNLQVIEDLNRHAKKFGAKIYFVGGIVRDLLMGVEIKDIDIVVEGDAIAFCETFAGGAVDVEIISIHPDFGTCKMKIKGVEIDFASTREETYPKSGCLPVVKNIGCALKNDVLRRDFTINSIALDLETEEIIDYLGGVADLQARVLKITYPESFIDDPTRILRALDFKLRFGFSLPERDMEEFFSNPPGREGLSISRVDLTLKKLFSGKNAARAYEKIIEQKLYKIFQDDEPKIAPQKLKEIINQFGADAGAIYLKAVKNDLSSVLLANTNYEIYKALGSSLKYNEIKHIAPIITGDDLIALGVPQGPKIGEILEKLLEIKLNSPQSSPKNYEEELEFAKKLQRNEPHG